MSESTARTYPSWYHRELAKEHSEKAKSLRASALASRIMTAVTAGVGIYSSAKYANNFEAGNLAIASIGFVTATFGHATTRLLARDAEAWGKSANQNMLRISEVTLAVESTVLPDQHAQKANMQEQQASESYVANID